MGCTYWDALRARQDLSKLKSKLDGNITNYLFCPLADSHDADERNCQCQQFGWAVEELYDEKGTSVVAFRFWKLIYDPAHSDDELWKKVMDESTEIFRTGHANQMPDRKRKSNMQKAHKEQVHMADSNRLHDTAGTMYRNLKSNADLEAIYQAYAGATDAHEATTSRPAPCTISWRACSV